MLRTFNCGIGMIVAAARADAERLVELLGAEGERAAIIGELRPREGEAVTFEGKLSL
jgi:phosphoribosylformylglycinamidine cyclo-ligase